MLRVEEDLEGEVVGRLPRSVDDHARALFLLAEHRLVQAHHGRTQHAGRPRPLRCLTLDAHPTIVPGPGRRRTRISTEPRNTCLCNECFYNCWIVSAWIVSATR